ncbi:MAG: deiodinase-like protein [Pelagimonas sp.]|uniref:deiodinase-like protein n=1 Tax=Pelagimonas sp. TaxID=2073170 RepID=UPI003D6BA829
MTYNYGNFDATDYDLVNFRSPQPGQKAPDFTIEVADGGGRARLLDFEGDFLVLEMGSVTCPLFQGRRQTMTGLDEQHSDISFAVLYVREAHPGANIPAHVVQDDKSACAAGLIADGENRRVFVDDIEGTVHTAYGGYPNSVFIINRNGCIVYAVDWNNPTVTRRALDLLKAGKPAALRAWFKPVPPQVSLRVLGAGGKGSMSDFLRGLPHLIWNNLIRRNVRLLLGRKTGVAPNIKC